MKKAVKPYLQELLAELNDIADFTVAGREVFRSDRRTQKAVIRSYEVIGEIVKRIPQDIRDTNPQVDWRKLAAFRDFLAHNYDDVILKNIWEAVEDLPNLKAKVEAVLNSLPDDPLLDG